MSGLSPAIAIEQRTTVAHPRSTVGTVSEIYDHLRVLFATLGRPHCPRCGEPIAAQGADEMAKHLLEQSAGAVAVIAAPVARGRKGAYRKELAAARAAGLQRARVDGCAVSLADRVPLDPRRGHRIDVLVDRLALRPDAGDRLRAGLEKALDLAGGVVLVSVEGRGERLLSQHLACARCDVSVPELTPRAFSFNSAQGACPACDGLGQRWVVDAARVIPDETRSVQDGALRPWHRHGPRLLREALFEVAERHGFSLEAPVAELPAAAREVLLFGDDEGFPGVVPYLRRRVDTLLRLDPSPADEEGPRRRRGVRGPAALPLRGGVPGLPRHAAPAREPRGARGGPLGGGPRAAAARPRARSRGRPSLRRAGAPGRRAARRGDPLAAGRARLARPRLPHPRPRDHHALRRRGAPPSARHPDRGADAGPALRPRRALGGPAPARQRPADRDARLHPRRREHRRGGRARRGDDPGRRLGDRPRRRRGRPRRAAHVRGPAGHDRRKPHRPLPPGRARVPVPATRRPARGWLRVLGARRTISATWTWRSPSAPSPR